jgi:glutathione S-transferase
VLKVGDSALFESAVILEYLEETHAPPLHPRDPLRRAEHRSLIEYGSRVLADIGAFYTAPDAAAFATRRAQLEERFAWLEVRASAGPWFDGQAFSLVDAVFGPVFRYFDAFDAIDDFGILTGKRKLARWRAVLADRPSIRHAVPADYSALLKAFLAARTSHLARLMVGGAAERG